MNIAPENKKGVNEPNDPLISPQLNPSLAKKAKLKRYSKWVNSFKDYLTYKDNPLTYGLIRQWITAQIKDWDTLQFWQIESLYSNGAPFPELTHRWITRTLELRAFAEKNGHARVRRNSRKDDDPLGKWVAWQRIKKEKLSSGQVSILDKLGFVWNPLEDSWNRYYQDLLNFHSENGHCRVPQCDGSKDPLAKWVARQRQKKSSLSKKQISLMDELDFSWNPLDESWGSFFQMLIEFKEKHGHCRVFKSNSCNPELRNWVQRQRSAYNAEKLSETKIEQLKNIGFDFYCYEANFNKWLDKLKAFRAEHGHICVPYKERSLSKWIQRTRNNKSKLPEAVIKKLDEINFVWQPKKKYWYERFEQLKEFHAKYGVSVVPCDYDMSFSGWVRDQKKRKRSLDNEQIQLLNSLGYNWNQEEHLPKTFFRRRGIKPKKIDIDPSKPNIFSMPDFEKN